MPDYAYTDSKGKGHLKIGNAGVARAALSRFNQTFFESVAKARTAWSHILGACKKFGIEVKDKAMPKPKIKEPSSGYKKASADDAAAIIPDSMKREMEGGVATFAVALPGDDAPEWIELIPAGKFSAVDGRGPFENEDPNSIVAASTARMPEVGLVLDYDHSTDLAAPEGRQSIAAGWIKQFRVADNGAIFARIEWTAKATEALKAKEYRYVSPVFEHSKDGKVERILRAALTNNPALINLPAIASAQVEMMAKEPAKRRLHEVMGDIAKIHPEADDMSVMKAAHALMGGGKSFDDWAREESKEPEHQSAENGEGGGDEETGAYMGADEHGGEGHAGEVEHDADEETEEQMAARHSDEMAKCATDDERAACLSRHAAEKERFAKKAVAYQQHRGLELQGKPGDSKMISPSISSLIRREVDRQVAKHPMMVGAQKEINSLRLERNKEQATAKVDAAIRDGRLIPSQRDWAIAYCSADPEGFAKFIGAQPKIIQAGADGTFTGRIGEPKEGPESLNSKELTIFTRLGLAESLGGREKALEKFLAARKERLSHAATLDAD